MRKRQDPSASQDDDDRKLISLQDKLAGRERLLQQPVGVVDADELKVRRGKVYAAVTPRELWKASGHRAGSRERADKAEIRRSIRLQLAIVVFAVIIMMFVLLGTILNNQGGTAGTPVFPWEWGSSDN